MSYIRGGLRLLQGKLAASKLEILRQLNDDGENSGEPADWSVEDFLARMKNSSK